MRHLKKVLPLLLALTLVLSLPVFSSAASGKKTVYVVTKIVSTNYDLEVDSAKTVTTFTYTKNGLLKKSVAKESGGTYSVTTTYQYGKKSRLKGYKYALYDRGKKLYGFKEKFTLNKKGYVTKIKSYRDDGDYSSTAKVKYNKKNKCTQYLDYDDEGDLSSKTKYTYKGKKCTAKRYNSNGRHMYTTVYTYKNGRVISEKTYSPKGKLLSESKYTYKKVKTTKKAIVKVQQEMTQLTLI